VVLHDSRPELFQEQLRKALQIAARHGPDDRIVFIKSWNEWAEGNTSNPTIDMAGNTSRWCARKCGLQWIGLIRSRA
jgi:hypothetical protein